MVWGLYFLCLASATVGSASSLGEEESVVATIAATIWPRSLSSPAGFDAASRGAILAFVVAIDRLGLGSAGGESVRHWREQAMAVLVGNYRAAMAESQGGIFSHESVVDSSSLSAAALRAEREVPSEWRAWYREVSAFFAVYAAEQSRLAARFPEPSSEIATFSRQEITGFERPDRHFLLTFDDGPTVRGGSSDRTVAVLRDNGLTGIFFVLGDNLAERIAANSVAESEALYRGMVVAVHGMDHRSPTSFAGWRESIRATQLLVDSVGPGVARRLYRPPYGRRTPDCSALLARDGYRLVLWNIDTVDWKQTVAADLIVGRTQLLMALWRRGIILFHDRYPQVGAALPALLGTMRKCGVVFDAAL